MVRVLLLVALSGFWLQRAYSTLMGIVPIADPDVFPGWFRYYPVLSVALAASLCVATRRARLRWPEYMWAVLLLAWSAVLFGIGLARHNPRYYLLLDAETVIVLIAGVVIGSSSTLWAYTRKLYAVLLLGAVPVVLLGLAKLDPATSEFGGKFIASAYDSQYILWPVGLFALFLGTRRRPRVEVAATALAFPLALFEQVLFLKRTPTARLIVSVVGSLFVSGRLRFRKLLRLLSVGAIALVIASISIYAVSRAFELRAADVVFSFIEHLREAGGDQITGFENARFVYAKRVIELSSQTELLIGRGLGGYVVDPSFGFTILTSSGRQEFGAAQVEVGYVWPLLKGGGVLAGLMGAIFVRALWPRFRRWSNNERACWSFTLITSAFLLPELLITHPNQLYWFLAASAMGQLLRTEKVQTARACEDDRSTQLEKPPLPT